MLLSVGGFSVQGDLTEVSGLFEVRDGSFRDCFRAGELHSLEVHRFAVFIEMEIEISFSAASRSNQTYHLPLGNRRPARQPPAERGEVSIQTPVASPVPDFNRKSFMAVFADG